MSLVNYPEYAQKIMTQRVEFERNLAADYGAGETVYSLARRMKMHPTQCRRMLQSAGALLRPSPRKKSST